MAAPPVRCRPGVTLKFPVARQLTTAAKQRSRYYNKRRIRRGAPSFVEQAVFHAEQVLFEPIEPADVNAASDRNEPNCHHSNAKYRIAARGEKMRSPFCSNGRRPFPRSPSLTAACRSCGRLFPAWVCLPFIAYRTDYTISWRCFSINVGCLGAR